MKVRAIALGLAVLATGAVVWFVWPRHTESPGVIAPQPGVPGVPSLPRGGPLPPDAPPALAVKADEKAPASVEKPPSEPASVTGHVRDTYSHGIGNASVVVSVFAEGHGPQRVLGTFTARTAPDGRYRIDGISVFGEVSFRATADGYVSLDTALKGRMPGAPTVHLIQSDTNYEDVDFQLKMVKSYVAGRVVNQQREPVGDASVQVALQYGSEERNRRMYREVTGEDGRFTIGLPSASECVLVVHKEGYADGYFPDILPGSTNLELTIRGGGTISGLITSKTGFPYLVKGTPLRDVEVSILPEASPGEVGDEWEAVGRTSAFTDENGAYRVDDLSEEFTYTVRVVLPQAKEITPPLRVRTVQDFQTVMLEKCSGLYKLNFASFMNGIAEETGVRVRAGRVTKCNLAVVSEQLHPALVHGYVSDASTGDPVFAVLVYAFSEDLEKATGLSGPLVNMTTTDSEGYYELPLPSVTESTTFVIKVAYWTAEGAFSSAEEKAEVAEVTLGPGDTRQVDFSFPGTVTLPVRFLSVNSGAPLAGVTLSLDGKATMLVSDTEGRVVARGLQPDVEHVPGAMRARLDGSGYLTLGASPGVSGKSGQILPEVTVACQSPGAFLGHVIAPQGVEIPPDTRIECQIDYGEQSEPVVRNVYLQIDGTFEVQDIFPGTCNIFFYVPSDRPEERWWGEVLNAEIAEGMVTDLGELLPQPPVK